MCQERTRICMWMSRFQRAHLWEDAFAARWLGRALFCYCASTPELGVLCRPWGTAPLHCFQVSFSEFLSKQTNHVSFHRGKKILRDGSKLFKGRFTFFTIYPLNNFHQPPASGNYKSIHAPLQLREQHPAWCQQGQWQSLQTSPLASTGVPPRGYGRQSHTRAVHSPALHSDICNHIQLFAFLRISSHGFALFT